MRASGTPAARPPFRPAVRPARVRTAIWLAELAFAVAVAFYTFLSLFGSLSEGAGWTFLTFPVALAGSFVVVYGYQQRKRMFIGACLVGAAFALAALELLTETDSLFPWRS